MCSFQTSTGTRLMHLVDENMDTTAEEDELMLVFWRLAGGAVEALLLEEDIFTKTRGGKICQKWPQKVTGCPEMALHKGNGRKNNIDV